jgi:hypothetical protein
MAKIKNELEEYQTIPRKLIFDNTISDRARFLYCYMAAKPNDWDFFLKPMATELGYSIETLRKYINELIANGWLVKGKQENENGIFGAVEYTLKANKVLPSTENTEAENFRHGKNPTQHNKDNIHKQDIIFNKENKEKSDVDLSFVADDFLPIVQDWLAYKKEKKQTYKQRGAKMFYSQLLNLSNKDAEVARLIIEQSMANNWAGIFPLKNKPKTTLTTKCQKDDSVTIGGQTYK